MSWGYDDNHDGMALIMNTQHASNYKTGEFDCAQPNFYTGLCLLLDPDEEPYSDENKYWHHYIESLELQINIVKQDGTFLDPNLIGGVGIRPCTEAYDYSNDQGSISNVMLDIMSSIARVTGMVGKFISSYGKLISTVATGMSLVLTGLKYLLPKAPPDTPPIINPDIINENYHGASWTTGKKYTLDMGPEPTPDLNAFSMVVDWSPDLNNEEPSEYQVQMKWKAEIYTFHSYLTMGWDPGEYRTEHAFTKTGSYYLNYKET